MLLWKPFFDFATLKSYAARPGIPAPLPGCYHSLRPTGPRPPARESRISKRTNSPHDTLRRAVLGTLGRHAGVDPSRSCPGPRGCPSRRGPDRPPPRLPRPRRRAGNSRRVVRHDYGRSRRRFRAPSEPFALVAAFGQDQPGPPACRSGRSALGGSSPGTRLAARVCRRNHRNHARSSGGRRDLLRPDRRTEDRGVAHHVPWGYPAGV